MKPIRTIFSSVFILGAFVALLSLLHAQETASPTQPQPAQTDSIVQLTAEAQGLELVSPADLPRSGTFWLVTPYGMAPIPCPSLDLSLKTYLIAEGQYLIDATGGQAGLNHRDPNSTVASALAAQADAVVNLINRAQEVQFNREFARAFGLEDEFDSSDSFSPMAPLYDPAGLWLEITNVSHGMSYFNLHNATNQVYAIWSTTNLLTGWQVETELWPTNSEVMPFTLPTRSRENLFVRAQDWTGVDSNGDGIPDWWAWKYFGNVSEPATNDYDGDGVDNYDEFLNENDPNKIKFSIESTNDYVRTPAPTIQLDIATGVPRFIAIFVNSSVTTNWLSFNSTDLTVNLGATDGVYNVVVGLKGLPEDAPQVWRNYEFFLDRVAPVLTITNPTIASGAATTVIKPYLQIKGFTDKPLMSLSYDISNAAGLVTNLDVTLTDQNFDTNRFDFTTNWFQAYDVPLTNGVNRLTLRVTDRAGNTTTTNFDVNLDYTTATNQPVVKLIWPTNNMAVCGTNCTMRGTMSDETGTIAAQVVNGDGNTNLVTGIVERNHMFWLENVPLNGTNQISIQATDAAGNVTVTNFTVKPSSLVLTIDSTPTGDDLYKPTGSVSGHVSDPDALVTVNGIAATVQDNGQWTAEDVPNTSSGTATFDASAASANGQQGAVNLSLEMGAYVATVSYTSDEIIKSVSPYDSHYYRSRKSLTANPTAMPDGQWLLNDERHSDNYWFDDWGGYLEYTHDNYKWSQSTPGADTEHIDDSNGYNYDGPANWPSDSTAYHRLSAIPHEDQTWGCASCGPGYLAYWMRHYFANGVKYHWDLDSSNTLDVSVSAVIQVKVFTGGKAQVNRKNLFGIHASDVVEYLQPPLDYGTGLPWWNTPGKAIDLTSLIMAGKHPGADGYVWKVLADNSEEDITVKAPGKKHFNAESTVGKYKPYLTANGIRLDPDKIVSVAEFCVGQKIIFKLEFDPSLPDLKTNQNNWFLPAKYVNAKEEWNSFDNSFHIVTCDPQIEYFSRYAGYGESLNPACTRYQEVNWPLTQPETGAWWVSGGPKAVTCFPTLTFNNGQEVSLSEHGNFNMLKPEITRIAPQHTPFGGTVTVVAGELRLLSNAMNYYAYISKTYPGQFGITQLINRFYWTILGPTFVPIWSSTHGDYWLDTSEYYDGLTQITLDASEYPSPAEYPAYSELIDGPGFGMLMIGASCNVNCRDYIRFTPSGSDSIPITLERVDWTWNSVAEQDISLTWHITGDAVTGPDEVGDDSFPEWQNVDSSIITWEQ